MAWQFTFEDNTTPTTNMTPASNVAMVFNLKRALKARSWVVTQSSDGLTYNSTGDQITGSDTGANGLDNSKAWFVIRSPDSKIWWTFQRDTTAAAGNVYLWRVKISISAPASGSPGILQVPSVATASDEGVIIGGGSDASPTFAALFNNTGNGTFRQNIGVQDASPYNFWMVVFRNGRADSQDTYIIYDPLASGSYSASDPYPFMAAAVGNKSSGLTLSTSAYLYKHTKNGGARVWQPFVPGQLYAQNTVVNPGGAQNPEDGNDCLYYPSWIRPVSWGVPAGWVGVSTTIRLNFSTARAFGDTYTISTTRDAINFEDFVFPWDGSSPTI